jgi:hypothetical protein
LAEATSSAFIKWVLRTAPPMPRYYPRMKRVNAQGPDVLNGLPPVKSLDPSAFLSYLLGLKNVRNYDGSWTEYGNLIGVPIEK